MSVNNSTRDTEGSRSEPLEEKYWMALLEEGEFAKSTNEEAVIHDDETNPIASPIEWGDTYIAPANNSTDWDVIRTIQENDESVSLQVIGYNRGGLLVDWYSLRGFIPASQLLHFPSAGNHHDRKKLLATRVGDTLTLRVIELDIDKNRLIFSERAAQVESGKRNEILHELKAGIVVKGRITNLCDFGAFIDLGGIEGLIHISELSWGRVAHPSDMLTSGDTIEVYVLDVNENEERIALSLKQLHDDPWKTVQERYKVGELVEGRITNVVDFGAFACIEEGLEGLIHFSELAEGQFLHPRNVVSENDTVQARILNIDSQARRLGLSLRHI